MRYLNKKWVILTLLGLMWLADKDLLAQTPPNLSSGLVWSNWWNADTKLEIETQFNLGRRHEEVNRSLTSGILGNLVLPGDFLSLPIAQQALILLNEERNARNGVKYGSITYSVLPLEGVDLDLNQVAQAHADYMQSSGIFSHTGAGGTSSAQRINGAFSECTELTSENIAWNSYTGSGFISSIALALYNFIYDDACCSWGHRVNSLRMSTTTNNYDGTSKFGIVGFGRSSGANGDFFVMDFFDPRPASSTCQYNITNYETGGGGDCPENIVLEGNIASGTYQAIMSVTSSGMVPATNNVELMASNSVILNPVFEVQLGSVLSIDMDNCYGANARIQEAVLKWQEEIPTFLGNQPIFKMD